MAKRYEGRDACCTCFNKGYSDGNGDISRPCDLCDSQLLYYRKCEIRCRDCYSKNKCKYYINKNRD